MVAGLRERERVRDLFGRHVGREVAAAAEQERPEARRRGAPRRGHLRRHHRLDTIGDGPTGDRGRRAAEPVLRRDRRRGRPPPRIRQQVRGRRGAGGVRRPDSPRPSRGRGAGGRARRSPSGSASEVPECEAGIGVAAGQAVAGNVGAKERFEYTVIGEPVNEAARLCELGEEQPSRLLASSRHGGQRDRKRSAPLVVGRHRDAARPRRADPAGGPGLTREHHPRA